MSIPEQHPITKAFIAWKKNNLDLNLKNKATTILEPVIVDLVKQKTLSEEQKAEITESSKKITEIIDKHFTTITTKKVIE